MGGPSSGRWGDYKKRGIVEHSLVLSIEALLKAGLDPAGECSGSVSLDVPSGGGVKATLEYRLNPGSEPLLFYSLEPNGLTGHIRLQKTTPHLGGVRWFSCPSPSSRWCDQRVGKLYLPPGAVYLGCRD